MKDTRVWADHRLAYIYLLAERIAEKLPEDSPEETALRHAMSKIDEADMCLKGIKVESA
jgi:hypothetical protein